MERTKFDPSVDKTIKSETFDFPEKNTKVVVAIKQYAEGAKKIQISRISVNDGKENFAKLGRLTKEEALKVADAMTAMAKDLE